MDMQALWVVLLQEEIPSGKVAALQCQWHQEAARQRGEQVVHQLEVCSTRPHSFPPLTSPSPGLVRQRFNSPDAHVAARRRELQRRWTHTGLQCRRRWLSNRKPIRRWQPHRQPLWRLHVLRRCFGRKPHPSLEPHRHIILLHKRPLLLPHPRSRTLLRPYAGPILPDSSGLEILRRAYARERFHDGADTDGTSEQRVRWQHACGDRRGADAKIQRGRADAVQRATGDAGLEG